MGGVLKEGVPAGTIVLAACTGAAVAKQRQKKRLQRGALVCRAVKKGSVARSSAATLVEPSQMVDSGKEDSDSSAQRELCFVDKMTEAEERKLRQLQTEVAGMFAALKAEHPELKERGISFWGVDLESPGVARDIIFLKFLRAEEVDVSSAAKRLQDTLKFRIEESVDALVEAELPEHFRGHDEVNGCDVDGRPLLISHYGAMDNQKVFGNPDEFVRYRMKVMEDALGRLTFTAGAAEDLCQVHDYSGVNIFAKTSEVKKCVAEMTKTFTAHYPETKGKTLFVKFPTVFAKFFQAFSVFIPERTRKKFQILGEFDHQLLFSQIAPEFVPESLGGMYRAGEAHTVPGECTVVSVKAGSTSDVDLQEVMGPSAIAFEVRTCAKDVCCEVFFEPASGAESAKVELQGSSEPLKLTEESGIVAGRYEASEAGVLKCRFSHEGGWLQQQRVCVCRATVL